MDINLLEDIASNYNVDMKEIDIDNLSDKFDSDTSSIVNTISDISSFSDSYEKNTNTIFNNNNNNDIIFELKMKVKALENQNLKYKNDFLLYEKTLQHKIKQQNIEIIDLKHELDNLYNKEPIDKQVDEIRHMLLNLNNDDLIPETMYLSIKTKINQKHGNSNFLSLKQLHQYKLYEIIKQNIKEYEDKFINFNQIKDSLKSCQSDMRQLNNDLKYKTNEYNSLLTTFNQSQANLKENKDKVNKLQQQIKENQDNVNNYDVLKRAHDSYKAQAEQLAIQISEQNISLKESNQYKEQFISFKTLKEKEIDLLTKDLKFYQFNNQQYVQQIDKLKENEKKYKEQIDHLQANEINLMKQQYNLNINKNIEEEIKKLTSKQMLDIKNLQLQQDNFLNLELKHFKTSYNTIINENNSLKLNYNLLNKTYMTLLKEYNEKILYYQDLELKKSSEMKLSLFKITKLQTTNDLLNKKVNNLSAKNKLLYESNELLKKEIIKNDSNYKIQCNVLAEKNKNLIEKLSTYQSIENELDLALYQTGQNITNYKELDLLIDALGAGDDVEDENDDEFSSSLKNNSSEESSQKATELAEKGTKKKKKKF